MITGTRGLAETLILRFSEAGHKLSVLARDAKRQNELSEKFPEMLFCEGDVSSSYACRAWFKKTVSKFGQVDCLINNAAIQGEPGRLGDLKFEEIRKVMETDLMAPLLLSKLAVEHFSSKKSGVVINLSGGGATGPRPRFIPYAISKCALVRLTETLAEEYPELRFYAVSPGGLKTTMTATVVNSGPESAGEKEFNEAKKRMAEGGDDPNRAATLMLWLIDNQPKLLNGRLISAIYDAYQQNMESLAPTGWWTLRRVDEVSRRLLGELD